MKAIRNLIKFNDMKKLLISLFLLFITVQIMQASPSGIGGNRFLKGELIFEDGTYKTGFIQIPKRPTIRKLNFKESENSKEEEIKTILIKSFTVYSDAGEAYSFESCFLDLNKDSDAERVTLYKTIFMVQIKGYASLYVSGDEYRLKQDGTVYIFSSNTATGEGVANFRYYIKKENKNFAEYFVYENPSSIITPDISRKSLVKSMEMYMADYPELIEKVRNKELKTTNLTEIFNLYNKFMAE